MVEPPRRCIVCRTKTKSRHDAYPLCCAACGDLCWRKRTTPLPDMTDRVALVTGGRTGIGQATTLRLLRAGASVIALTRFPAEAARQYGSVADAEAWSDRLRIVGLDLRQIVAVEEWARHLERTEPRLDVLINNAAQTRRLPGESLAALTAGESPLALPAVGSEGLPATLPADPDALSDSWRLKDHAVSALEMVEVQVVNAIAPFLLTSRLRPLLARTAAATDPKLAFVVNVTSREGSFSGRRKSAYHPHTNMAKAALNMFTLTCADDYRRDGILLNAVDPGWVSLQHGSQAEQGFAPPFDLEDAAARLLDPVAGALLEGRRDAGVLFKDYRPAPW